MVRPAPLRRRRTTTGATMARVRTAKVESPSPIAEFFEAQPKHVFRQGDLKTIYYEQAQAWRIRGVTSANKFITFLLEKSLLRQVRFQSEHYRDVARYAWGEPSPYELALSIGKNPYLSHASAMAIHGLTDQIPKVVYINDEQTPKNLPPPVLSQEGIDRAFAGAQRTSRAIYSAGSLRVIVTAGKHTGRLEVGQLRALDGTTVDATKLERTLIDIAVRPDYAGGPYQVLAAYTTARERVSVNVLVATLKKLAYAYPYHQVVGFYMQRAGYEPGKLQQLKRLGLDFDFYLAYGMRERDFDSDWRLYIPKGS
jgi:hypothetical protein